MGSLFSGSTSFGKICRDGVVFGGGHNLEGRVLELGLHYPKAKGFCNCCMKLDRVGGDGAGKVGRKLKHVRQAQQTRSHRNLGGGDLRGAGESEEGIDWEEACAGTPGLALHFAWSGEIGRGAVG